MLNKLAKYAFYSFLFLLPFRIDFLFLDFGIGFVGQIDYRTWFVQLSELFLWAGVLFFSLDSLFKKSKLGAFALREYALLVFLLTFVFALRSLASLEYLLHFLEFLLVYFIVSRKLVDQDQVRRIFLFVVCVTALWGIGQFLLQRDLGGQLLGEPVLNADILGVAKYNFGEWQLLRAYGPFSHPNLFAAYLLLAIYFAYCLKKEKLVILLLIALVFSFSRSAWLALFIAALFLPAKKKYLWFGLLVLPFVAVRFLDLGESLAERFHLLLASLKLAVQHPLGIGLGNFVNFYQDVSFYKIEPWELQPVHNYFLLTLVEMGVQGFLAAITVVWFWFKEAKNKAIVLPIMFLVLALFDHYFYSFFQGVMLFALIFTTTFDDCR